MMQIAKLGLLVSLVALSVGCRTVPAPIIVRQCPAIPASLLVSCYAEAPVPRLNGELAEQWIMYRSCAAEQSIRLAAIAAVAACRVELTEGG